jgi:hypothetical protein
MASGIGSPLGIFAVILLIIGIIMAIIGIISLIARAHQPQSWWMWTMLIAGIVLAIFGGILIAVAMSTHETAVVVAGPVAPVVMAADQCGVGVANPPVIKVGPYNAPNSYANAPYAPAANANVGYVASAGSPEVIPTSKGKFTPDPQSYTRVVQPPPERRIMIGPYGPGNSTIEAEGLYTPPAYKVIERYQGPTQIVG